MPRPNAIEPPIFDAATIERFWSCVDKTAGCWLWTGYKTAQGYGRFTVGNGKHGGLQLRANRVAYMLSIGPIAPGMLVCHNCPDGDNPSCVNPAHLWLGTDKDNTQDSIRKGRKRRPGWRPYGSKLTYEQATEIRHRYKAGGVLQRVLATEFGVSVQTIFCIISGRTFKV